MRRAVTSLLGLVALLVTALIGVVAAPAAFAGGGEGGEQITGLLLFVPEQGDPQRIEGVTITVTAEDGSQIASVQSNAEGAYTVPLPGPGKYTVTLEEGTLPEGVTLRDPDAGSVETVVNPQEQRAVLFALGEGTRETEGKGEQAIRLVVEGLLFGLLIALASLGLSLIFGTTGLTNFAHGEIITFGAMMAFLVEVLVPRVPFYDTIAGLPVLSSVGGLAFLLAAVAAVVLTGAFGWVQDTFFWRVLRRRGTGLIAMMIVSIGLAIFLRYSYQYFFGASTRSYASYSSQAGLELGPLSIAPRDLVAMGICVVVLVAVSLALLRTRTGKATRAVADNPPLAAASGIDVDRVISVVWVIGAALAGLAGVLLGLSQQVNFQMGFQMLLLVFAAVVLGGLGTAWGALVGSLVVGMFVQVSTLVIPAELKNASALAVLIVILLVRPQGILGRAERVG